MFTSRTLVFYALIALVSSTSPISLSECGTLETSFATYQLAKDIVISDNSDGFVCFDIKGNGITLEGNGFGLSSASNELLSATGVQYSGSSTTVRNMRITNFKTGIRANGKYGKVEHNTITQAVNGIDVCATHNDISNNAIGNFNANESTSGIYVFFPARVPISSYINVTNNVISNIRGDSFVLGISVYYATSIYVANNRIFDLIAGVSKEEISVIQSNVDMHNNIFGPPEEAYLPNTTFLLSCMAVCVSALWFFRESPTSTFPPKAVTLPPINSKEKEEEKKKAEEEEKEKEKAVKGVEVAEFEMDGADVKVKSTLSFSVGSSPPTMAMSL